MVDYLQSLGVDCDWKTSLEIGAAAAGVSRLINAEDRVVKSTCVDIYDGSRRLTTNRFLNYLKAYRLLAKTGRYIPNIRNKLFGDLPKYVGYHPPKHSKAWNVQLKAEPAIDNYAIDDFITHDFHGKFDFIFAIRCLEYMDHDDAFAKISELLSPGGIFFFVVDYWWYPVNPTRIVGNFPYACQRLEKEDLKRYYLKEFPDKSDDMLERYEYFHKGEHPTITDYVKKANEVGLEVVNCTRLIENRESTKRTPLPPAMINRLDSGYLMDVLSNIHQFNNDVRFSDLLSPYVVCAFVKNNKKNRSLDEHVEHILEKGSHGNYKKPEQDVW